MVLIIMIFVVGTEKNHLNQTLNEHPTFFLLFFLTIFFSCASCLYALKYFCNVELMALYAILAGNDVTSFNVTPI